MRTIKTILPLLVLTALIATVAYATWVADGNMVSDNEGTDNTPCIVSDGAGGAIIAWPCDLPHPNPHGVFANRITNQGSLLWGVGGIRVDAQSWNSNPPVDMADDGVGGAVICWAGNNEDESPTIRAQRVLFSGAIGWTAGGAELRLDTDPLTPSPVYPRITSDGAGGAIVVWIDQRWGIGNNDLYAQRVDGAGNVLWSVNGVAICTNENSLALHRIVTDGDHGAIIVWRDARNVDNSIYAQRINGSGVVQWTVDGIRLKTETVHQEDPRLISDGDGGAIITWEGVGISAQRIDASGTLLWGADGVQVRAITGYGRQMAGDGFGGAVFSWKDIRLGANGIYAQRLDPDGNALWTDQGVAVCLSTMTTDEIRIVGNDLGGAVVTWLQKKTTYDEDIYARIVNAAGVPMGSAGGTALCTDLISQYDLCIAADGANGGIVGWRDRRFGGESEYDIYAARIYANGSTDVELPTSRAFALAQNYPNPFNPITTIRFDLAERGFVELTIYSVAGRRLATLVSGVREVGPHTEVWDGRDDDGRLAASGAYFYRLDAGTFSETKRMVLLK